MHGSTGFLIAFFTSLFTALGTVYVVERFDVFKGMRDEVELAEVPDLKGLSEGDARENLKAQKFNLLIKARIPSGEAKEGTVLAQSVSAGQKIPVGHPIAVTLAQALPKVPDLSGLTEVVATERLRALGFKLKLGEPIADPLVPAGNIVAQTPAPDGVLEEDGVVVVQASSGPGEVEVPKVVGMNLTAAKAELEKAGLKLAPVRWVSIAETATFVVLNQKPEPAKRVAPETEIQLTANR